MQRTLALFLVFLIIFPPLPSFAEEKVKAEEIGEKAKDSKTKKKKKKKLANRHYEADIGGIKDYMDDLATFDPESHTVLDGDFSALYTRDKVARWGGLGIIGAGATLFLGGFSFLGTPGPNDPISGDPTTNANMTAVGVGIGLIATGLLSVMFLVPSRDDLKGFVVKHNRYRPKYPLRIDTKGGDSHFNFNPNLLVPRLSTEDKDPEVENLRERKPEK